MNSAVWVPSVFVYSQAGTGVEAVPERVAVAVVWPVADRPTVPVFVPAAVGLYVTLTAQVPPPSSVVAHVVVAVNGAAGATTATPANVAVPLFLNVTAWAVLGVPAAVAKVSVAGVAVIAAVPVPVTGNVGVCAAAAPVAVVAALKVTVAVVAVVAVAV
jgi:hypothetical protein